MNVQKNFLENIDTSVLTTVELQDLEKNIKKLLGKIKFDLMLKTKIEN